MDVSAIAPAMNVRSRPAGGKRGLDVQEGVSRRHVHPEIFERCAKAICPASCAPSFDASSVSDGDRICLSLDGLRPAEKLACRHVSFRGWS